MIPDIVQAVLDCKTTHIKRTPCNSTRASSLGYFVPQLQGCLRRGFYERTAWQEKELHDAGTQLRFDEGNHQERAVLKDLAEAGVDIIAQQTMFEWRELEITGHVDGKMLCEIDGKMIAVPIEIKSMAPAIFDNIHTFDDMRQYPWTRSYMVQIMLYMMMQSVSDAVFILKEKSSGQLRQINVKLDYELTEHAIKAAEIVRDSVRAGVAPEGTKDIDVCAKCPFKLKCHPGLSFGTPLTVGDDPSLADKIDRWKALKPIAKECEELYDDHIKDKVKATAIKNGGEINMILGNWHITGKLAKNGSLRPDFEYVGSSPIGIGIPKM